MLDGQQQITQQRTNSVIGLCRAMLHRGCRLALRGSRLGLGHTTRDLFAAAQRITEFRGPGIIATSRRRVCLEQYAAFIHDAERRQRPGVAFLGHVPDTPASIVKSGFQQLRPLLGFLTGTLQIEPANLLSETHRQVGKTLARRFVFRIADQLFAEVQQTFAYRRGGQGW